MDRKNPPKTIAIYWLLQQKGKVVTINWIYWFYIPITYFYFPLFFHGELVSLLVRTLEKYETRDSKNKFKVLFSMAI